MRRALLVAYSLICGTLSLMCAYILWHSNDTRGVLAYLGMVFFMVVALMCGEKAVTDVVDEDEKDA